MKVTSITIKLKDVSDERYLSSYYPVSVRYDGIFAIVTDSEGNETAYPESRIKKIEVNR